MKSSHLRFWLALSLVGFAARAQAQSLDRVAWQPQWREVEPIEYGVTLGLALGTLAISLWVEPHSSGGYGGFFFDDAIRAALRAHTREGRDVARYVGDTGFRTMLFFPLVDVGLNWAIHGDGKVAWQMLSMDAEVMAFAGFVGVLTDHVVGRARPSERLCREHPNYERFCNKEDEFSSFVSGHSVIAAAGAGVTCAHHLSLPLYGGGAGDASACIAAIGVAVATGVARIVNDRHWATDVSLGLLVGGFAGYVWPKWFHYRSGGSVDDRSGWMWLPIVAPGQISGSVLGAF